MSRAPGVKAWVRLLVAGASVWAFSACSAYYNTYFNAEKAHDQALRLREKRLEINPEDTVTVSAEEKTKLQRAIAKGSKVLELWPDNKKYAPKAVFLIADSYLLMEEYDLAAPKYAEFLRYYPNDRRAPLARVRMAKALYLDGQSLNARDALDQVMALNPQGQVRREALLLSAQMQVEAQSTAEGLALYERLLAEGAFTTPETRAEAHWQAANLAARLGRWEEARAHAQAGDLSSLPVQTQYRNRKFAVVALYELRRYDAGLAEVRAMAKDKRFRGVRADLTLLRARGLDGKGEWAAAERTYRAAAREVEGRGPVASEAFYRVAQHLWEQENNADSARVYFDSAAAAGAGIEFGTLGGQRARSLERLIELRAPDTTNADSLRPHYRDFAVAEVFFFELDRPDSARARLERIAASDVEDSTYSRRALYALAYIEENAFRNRARAEELYRAILARYPATEWAKQSERNLGLPPTVQTDEDRAHALFLQAEERRLAGAPIAQVVPAYREIVDRYPRTSHAAKAQFVVASLREQTAAAAPGDRAAAEAAKAAYEEVRNRFPDTPYAVKASEKLDALAAGAPAAPSAPDPMTPPDDGEEIEETPAAPTGRETLDLESEEDLY